MASSTGHQNDFNQAKLSDVTIKAGRSEVKCHRVILSRASPVLEKLVDPDSGFKEGREGIVELNDDDPVAVVAMLRFIYDFEYTIDKDPGKSVSKFHLSVFKIAHKFQMPRLVNKAEKALDEALARLRTTVPAGAPRPANYPPSYRTSSPQSILELAQTLADVAADYGPHFTERCKDLVQVNMEALVQLKEFRVWLVQADSPILPCLFGLAQSSTAPKTHKMTMCRMCPSIFVVDFQGKGWPHCRSCSKAMTPTNAITTQFDYLGGRVLHPQMKDTP